MGTDTLIKIQQPLHKVHFPEDCHLQTEKSIGNS